MPVITIASPWSVRGLARMVVVDGLDDAGAIPEERSQSEKRDGDLASHGVPFLSCVQTQMRSLMRRPRSSRLASCLR
jgi:hypothetical protein